MLYHQIPVGDYNTVIIRIILNSNGNKSQASKYSYDTPQSSVPPSAESLICCFAFLLDRLIRLLLRGFERLNPASRLLAPSELDAVSAGLAVRRPPFVLT